MGDAITSGYMISSTRTNSYFKSLKTIVWLLPFLWVKDTKIRLGIVTSLFFMLCTVFLNAYIPILFKNIINYLSGDMLVDTTIIPFLCILYGMIWIGSQAGQQLTFIGVIPALERGIRLLNVQIFQHLHALSMRFHLDKKTGALTNAIDRTQTGFDAIFWALFLFIIPTIIEMIIISIIFTQLYGFEYSCILACTALCYFIWCTIGMTMMDTMHLAYNQKKSRASETFVDSILTIETVKYFHNQKYEYEKCNAIFQQQEAAGIRFHLFNCFFQCVQKAIIGIGLVMLTWKAGNAVLAKTMSVGDFVLIHSYLLQFTAPLSGFGYIMRQVKKGLNDMDDILNLLAIKPEIQDVPHAHMLNSQMATIVLNNVSFSYNAERQILKNISLSIPSGKTVAIVGPTGSGKSTITRLLFRFYDPTQGTILFNDHDIRMVTQESLHNAIGVVAQETNLFNNTLYYNIAYGRPSASQKEIEEVIEHAQLSECIKKLPDDYNTIVGERGLKLSGGEKQRIAIARVLLKNPALYIFDEATSSLDTSTEREIQKNLRALAYGKTTLIIAHRLSTITYADEIIVLDNGLIVERGTHTALLERCGMYHDLWYKQERTMSFIQPIVRSSVIQN